MRKLICIIASILLLASVCEAQQIMVIKKKAGGCTPTYGSELATGANATDDGGGNETDATTGWSGSSLGTFDSIDTAPQAGTYHITAVADSSIDTLTRGISGLSASTLYQLSFYARHNGTASGNGEWRCYLSGSTAGNDTFITPILVKTDTTYAQYVKYFYYNARQDSVVCQERNAANDGGIYVDNYSIKAVTSPCLGSELYTASNAIAIGTEADATTGITGTGSPTLESTETSPGDGNSSLLFTATANADSFYIDLSSILTNGKKYFVSYKYKYVSGDSFYCGFDTDTAMGFVLDTNEKLTPSTADTTWVHYGISIVYDSNHRYFGCIEDGSNNNASFGIDAFSIKEITAE